jgi:hypothetical protein
MKEKEGDVDVLFCSFSLYLPHRKEREREKEKEEVQSKVVTVLICNRFCTDRKNRMSI